MNERRLSVKLVPNFVGRWCHVVSVTDPYGRILDFLDRDSYVFFPVVPKLYSRGDSDNPQANFKEILRIYMKRLSKNNRQPVKTVWDSFHETQGSSLKIIHSSRHLYVQERLRRDTTETNIVQRDQFEISIIAKPMKIFPAIYGSQNFIKMFTGTKYCSLF
jgi:hypothetical protein